VLTNDSVKLLHAHDTSYGIDSRLITRRLVNSKIKHIFNVKTLGERREEICCAMDCRPTGKFSCVNCTNSELNCTCNHITDKGKPTKQIVCAHMELANILGHRLFIYVNICGSENQRGKTYGHKTKLKSGSNIFLELE
jgi:hypothetical protein